ncbi:MAG TPA: ATP-grasp domain-containing protein [Dehalococcoidales bacterium]|nr:ATP-grasp domain-containing protein [Dehalococcoidales bacterium]
MRVGLSFDLKTAVAERHTVEDAFEEYDSPETVNIISAALQSAGHEIVKLGGGAQFLDNIRREAVDIVFNIAEGRGTHRSREAQVPSVLEMLDIPYTGSDPLTLAVSLDKPVTKKLLATEGVITPAWLIINNETELKNARWRELRFPVIIKPAYEGSSKGIRLTSLAQEIRHAQEEVGRILADYHQPVMVEEFIDGEEITIGVVGNAPPSVVGIMRVVPRKKPEHFVYSLEVKRDYLNLVDYECPANLPQGVLQKLEESSLKAFKALGCRDFSRIDYRVSADGTPYFIEINPLPGLGTYSDLVIMATMLGWTHEGLIRAVFEAACARYPQCVGV